MANRAKKTRAGILALALLSGWSMASGDQRRSPWGLVGIRAFELTRRQAQEKSSVKPQVQRQKGAVKVRVVAKSIPGRRRITGITGQAIRAALLDICKGQKATGTQLARIERRLDALSEMLSVVPAQLTALGATSDVREVDAPEGKLVTVDFSIPEAAAQGVIREMAVSDRAVVLQLRETVDGRPPAGEAGAPAVPRMISALESQGYEVHLADGPEGAPGANLEPLALASLAGWTAEVSVTTRRIGRFEEIERYASRAEFHLRHVRTGRVLAPVAAGEVEGNGATPALAADHARVKIAKEIGRRFKEQCAKLPSPGVKVIVPANDAEALPEIREAIQADPESLLVIVGSRMVPGGTELEIRGPDGAAGLGAFFNDHLKEYALAAVGES